MERRPIGLVPCLMLERSLLRDSDDRNKQELLHRARTHSLDTPPFEIEWITIGTTARPTHIMIKCVLAAPTDHQRITKLWSTLQTGSDELYPTTFDYQPLVIPNPRTSAFDQELNQAISRHLSYIKSVTQTILLGLSAIDLFTFIPKVTLLSGFPDDQNKHTIAHLLRHGIIDTTDSCLTSPVERITTDAKGSRLYLHGFRADATNLLLFTREVAHLLPAWLEDDQLEITMDTSDADRVSHSTPQSNPPPKPAQQTPTPLPTVTATTASPSLQTEMLQIPTGQWNRAMHTINKLTQRLATMEHRFNMMQTTLENTPTIDTLCDTMDDVISILTQNITLSSDSIKEHAAHTSATALTTITRNIDTNNGNILKLCDAVNTNIASSATTATTITDALSRVSDMATNFSTSGNSFSRPPSPQVKRASSEALDNFTTGIAPTLNLDSEVSPAPSDNAPAHASGQANTGAAPPVETPVMESTDTRTSTRCESPAEDLTRPRTAACFGCNKIDDSIQQCDHCELPFHEKCLIAPPPGGISHYCPDCINKLLPEEPQSPPSPHTLQAEGSGLTDVHL